MKVTITKGSHHNVSITGDFKGPYINLDVSPAEAYELLLALKKEEEQLHSLALNYYECRECGQTHHRNQGCPMTGQVGAE